MELKLLKIDQNSTHVSENTLKDFENEIEIYCNDIILKKKAIILNRVVNKLNKIPILLKLIRTAINFFSKKNGELISIIMGVNFAKCFPEYLQHRNNYVYFFDAWPKNHEQIRRFIVNSNVQIVFFSSKQVTEFFSKELYHLKFYWLPEGINPKKINCNNVDKKNDVIQFGRKYDYYHELIVSDLRLKGYSYKYERIKGEILFEDTQTFYKELCNTKISICFPSAITHPSRSGNINTMTVRYLESMVAKCLIVGQIPDEMVELFGYIPIIKADFDNPTKQLEDILNNYNQFEELIERNYDMVLRNHKWSNRAAQMVEIINSSF